MTKLPNIIMNKTIILPIIVFWISSITFQAQSQESTRNITGEIADSSGNPIQYATVSLAFDSKEHKLLGAITNSEGQFSIDSIPAEACNISISFVGYATRTLRLNASDSTNLGRITLCTNTINVESVTVTGLKTGVHNLIDRTVYIPNTRAAKAAATSYDLIEKVPGVSIRFKDMQIRIGNSFNVLVLVNGASSNQNLSSINPKNIERIEVIRNPTAEYGSETTNVLNIILKEKPTKGVTLAINTGYSFISPSNIANIQLGYAFKNIKLFGGFQLRMNSENRIKINTKRTEHDDEGIAMINSISNDGNFSSNNQQFQYGTDFKINNNTLLSFTGSLTPSNYNENATTFTQLYLNSIPLWNFKTTNAAKFNAIQQNYNIYLKHEFSQPKQMLEINSDLMFLNRNRQNIYSHIDNPEETTNSRKENTNNENRTNNIKLTYTQPLHTKWILRSGIQYYDRNIYNHFKDLTDDSYENYSEIRSTFFSNINYNGRNFSFKNGIGIEHSRISIYNDEVVRHKYVFLPSASISYRLNKRHSLLLSYNQWLNYPHYLMLIPFIYHSGDSLSASIGNPNLKPARNGVVKLSHSLDIEEIELSLSYAAFYTHTTNKHELIYKLQDNVLINHWENTNWSESYGGSLESSIYILDAIDISVDANLYYSKFPNSKYNGLTAETFIGIEVSLPFQLNLGCETHISSKEHEPNGYYRESPYIDRIYLRKSIFKEKGSFTLIAIEPFLSIREEEMAWDKSFSDYTTTKHNGFALGFRFSYFFNQGNSVKRIEKESLIEEQSIK